MKDSISNIVNKKFREQIVRYHMLDGKNGVLVGFSGGADSSAMLHILNDECKRRGIYLKAVHIHHGIRGDEADRDAEFCEKIAVSIDVDFELVRADIPAMAEKLSKGLEETARDFRYSEFLRIITDDERLDCLSTAHNLDDNAETLLFNLIRGSGVGGLAAIPPIRKLGEYDVIRPLLSVRKREIIGYCNENSIEFIHDSTNDDTVYTRNYIRHELIPAIEKLNPSFLDTAGRLSNFARTDDDYLDAQAKELISGERKAKSIANAHQAIASRAVRLLYSQVSEHTLEAVHIESVLGICRTLHGEVSLPDRVYCRIENGELIFSREKRGEDIDFCSELKVGINRIDGRDFAVILSENGEDLDQIEKNKEILKKIYKKSIHTELKSDTINHMLFVRSRHTGDSYVFGKMTRKLKKLYNDRNFDETTRRTIPIFCDEFGIVWIPGFPTADRVKPDGCGSVSIDYYYN